MLLTRIQQIRLHALCIRKHLKGVAWEVRGLCRALRPPARMMTAILCFVLALAAFCFLGGCLRSTRSGPLQRLGIVSVET